jgi:hypothetical protein
MNVPISGINAFYFKIDLHSLSVQWVVLGLLRAIKLVAGADQDDAEIHGLPGRDGFREFSTPIVLRILRQSNMATENLPFFVAFPHEMTNMGMVGWSMFDYRSGYIK